MYIIRIGTTIKKVEINIFKIKLFNFFVILKNSIRAVIKIKIRNIDIKKNSYLIKLM